MSRLDIRLLELMEFFITKHNYSQIKFSKDESNDEIWLIKPDNSKYQLIRVTKNSIEQVRFEKTKIDEIKGFLSNNFKKNIEILDIHIGKDEVLDSEVYDSIVLDYDYYSGVNVEDIFPGIQKAIYQIFNKEEADGISKRIASHVRSNIRTHADRRQGKRPIATYVVMVICVIIAALVTNLGSAEDAYISSGIVFGAYYKAFVMGAQEYWRFITSGFVHTTVAHLLMNMYSFFILGGLIERRFGAGRMLLVLITGIIFGNMFVYINNANIVATGLSGGIFALFGAYIVDMFDTGLIRNPQIRRNLIMNLILVTFISLLPNVSFFGHLGGLVSGILVSGCFIANKNMAGLKRNSIIASAFFAVLMLYLTFSVTELGNIYLATDYMVFDQLKALNLGSYASDLEMKMLRFYSSLH